MEQFIEFIGNHSTLASTFAGLIILLLWTESKRAGKPLSTHHVINLMNKDDAKLVDIRDKKEFDKGHINGAVNIPLAKLKTQIHQLESHKDKPVVVVCKMGHHASLATKTLDQAGFSQVSRMKGGMTEWQMANLPTVS